MSSPRQEDLPTNSASSSIKRVMSQEGAPVPAQSIFNFRPAANFLNFAMSPLQKVVGVVRFVGACCITNMTPYFEVGRPFGDIINWALVNPSLYFGMALYSLVSKHPQDILDNLRSQGRGYVALGLLIISLKVILANIPSVLVGVGLGFAPVFVSPVFARIIAAAVSPWLYIATEKLIVDRIFPPAQMHKATEAPPLHFLQQVGLLGFTLYDATRLWMLAIIILREFRNHASVEEVLSSPWILAGVLPLYVILNYIVDPYLFGPRPLNNPPALEIRVTDEDTLDAHPEEQQRLLMNSDDPDESIPSNLDDIPTVQRAGGTVGTEDEVRADKIKATLIFSACTILSIGAGLAADVAAAKIVGDPAALSDSAFQATVALPCAVMAVTQLGLTTAAPWVMQKASSCWAHFFNPAPVNDTYPADPLLIPDDELHNNNAPVLPMPAAVQQPESKPWYSRAASHCMSFFSTSEAAAPERPQEVRPAHNADLTYPTGEQHLAYIV